MKENLNEMHEVGTAEYEATGLAKISKSVKESMVYITKEQIKAMVDRFYQAQHDRIELEAQLKAINQGRDKDSDTVKKAEKKNTIIAMEWLCQDAANREAQIKEMLNEYCKSEPVCVWAMQIKGIGPVIASYLWAHLDLNKCNSVGAFHSYAGLNDNNNPWLGVEKATAIVKEVYEELGYDKKHEADERVIAAVSEKTTRRPNIILNGINVAKESNKKKKLTDMEALIKYLSKPPYNEDLKTMCCFKIPRLSFAMNCNRGSLYGELYKERKAYEERKNKNLEYADQAAAVLKRRKKYLKKKEIKTLESGMLLDSHITTRALRRSVKIFLSHFWECAYRYEHKSNNRAPLYVMDIAKHKDYIEPEVPFPDFSK